MAHSFTREAALQLVPISLSQSQAIFTLTLSKGNNRPLCSGYDIITLLLSLHISFIFSTLTIFINNEVILKNINLEI